ncbi:hypothetical protein AB0J57_34140 [Streptomyces sp. NPDC049837]|uniref:hypothetical protein n=1 Tax=Streptomyces sp. NPDC049837 TaxID=3155277 RepID=UPI00344AE46C
MIKGSAGLFDRRFFLGALLPTLAFLCGAGVLTTVVARGPGGAKKAWSALPLLDKSLTIAAVITVAVIVATLLSGSALHLVRWYEGYWPTRLGRLMAELGSTWHRRRRRTLAEAARTDPVARGILNDCYPPATPNEPALPTRLGNVLRSAERHPRLRYGIDTVTVWPRLYPLLPDRVVAGLNAGRATMEAGLVTATLFAAFALYAGTLLMLGRDRWWLFACCFGGGMLVARLFYRTAVSAAIGYAEQLKAAFDVYRLDLLRQLDGAAAPDGAPGTIPPSWTAPADPAEERHRWQSLSLLWLTGVHDGIEESPQPRPPVDRGTRFMIVPLSTWLMGAVALVCLTGALILGNPA